jgi:hypothetical protein
MRNWCWKLSASSDWTGNRRSYGNGRHTTEQLSTLLGEYTIFYNKLNMTAAPFSALNPAENPLSATHIPSDGEILQAHWGCSRSLKLFSSDFGTWKSLAVSTGAARVTVVLRHLSERRQRLLHLQRRPHTPYVLQGEGGEVGKYRIVGSCYVCTYICSWVDMSGDAQAPKAETFVIVGASNLEVANKL